MIPQPTRIALLERTLSMLDALAHRRDRNPLPIHLAIGLAGEDAAFFHLRRHGYTVAARRWTATSLRGDVDLIAWKEDLLCFCEVKTRTARDMTPAESAVDNHKRHMLRRLARAYLRQLALPVPPNIRFDVLSVYLLPNQQPQITHFEAAFPITQ